MKERPRPKLTKTKDGWHVSNGWIGNAYFEIVEQPSDEAIQKLHELLVLNSRLE